MYLHSHMFLCCSLILVLLMHAKCYCNDNFEFGKTLIIKEINLNIPSKSTIRLTQVPRGIILSVAQKELFEDNSIAISSKGKVLLAEIAKLLNSFDNACTIEAHTEEFYVKGGTANSYDWEYSVIRANNIANYLVKKYGVKSSRLFPIGFGYIMPFKDNVSDEIFYNNRIDFVIFDYTASR